MICDVKYFPVIIIVRSFGVIKNPNVPALKQVNLYQKGLASAIASVLHVPGIALPPQYGTVL